MEPYGKPMEAGTWGREYGSRSRRGEHREASKQGEARCTPGGSKNEDVLNTGHCALRHMELPDSDCALLSASSIASKTPSVQLSVCSWHRWRELSAKPQAEQKATELLVHTTIYSRGAMDLTPCLLILGIFLPWNGCGFSQPVQLDTISTGNKCKKSTTCPAYSKCTPTNDSFYCTCKLGYRLPSGEVNFTDYSLKCGDIDECAQNSSICGPHTICTNKKGDYNCGCSTGFATSRGSVWIKGRDFCTDIDECRRRSSCPEHSTCQNTVGSFYCTCNSGYTWSNSTGSARCEAGSHQDVTTPEPEIPLNCENENLRRCQSQPDQDSFCRLLISTFSIIQGLCEKKNEINLLQSTANGVSQVLNQTSSWSNLSRQEVAIVGTSVLETVESTILASLRRPGGNTRQNIATAQLDVETKVIEDDCKQNTLFTLSAKGDRMNINCRTITGNRTEVSGGVAFVSFSGMELLLDGSFFKDQDADASETLLDVWINSRVVSSQITSEKKSGFSDPIIFTLENFQEKNDTQKVICVFWNATKEGGSWSRKGCEPLDFNRTHTVCSCYHLSSFAVIMAISEIKDDFTLQVLTYAGLTFSLLCLTLAIFTFILCRSIRNTNTSIHLQLCVCLFLAERLLLTGIKRTSNKTGCAIIAWLLHYLFLACFSWMFMEALLLFLTVVNYFNTRKIKMLHMSFFAYGFPALIVIISASVKPGSYGTDKNCWLDANPGLVWSFLGPVCAFLVINSSLFVITLGILRVRLSTVNADVSTLKDTRLLTFKASAQLFILGCTWIMGIFQIGGAAMVMAYLFTIINSLQGAFIFLVHCVLNRQVREEYHRWFKRIHKPSSESQSSGTTTSTAAMTMTSMESTVQTR